MNIEQARRAIDALAASLPVEAITGTLLHRAWLKSGRPDPLIDSDAWDGFALTIQALAKVEGLVGRLPTVCGCGDFVPDSSGDAGCGNCGADIPPEPESLR